VRLIAPPCRAWSRYRLTGQSALCQLNRLSRSSPLRPSERLCFDRRHAPPQIAEPPPRTDPPWCRDLVCSPGAWPTHPDKSILRLARVQSRVRRSHNRQARHARPEGQHGHAGMAMGSVSGQPCMAGTVRGNATPADQRNGTDHARQSGAGISRSDTQAHSGRDRPPCTDSSGCKALSGNTTGLVQVGCSVRTGSR
jgi:hypothetical protein